MISNRTKLASRRGAVAALFVGALLQLGFIENCDDRLATLTRFVDPCGTVLGNCNPGDFQINRADVGDYCVDPSCTVPGQCGSVPVLGTVTNLCP